MKYMVKEIFGPTIEGEGKYSGTPVLFLRFTGCNKWSGRQEDKAASACPFCDTDFVGGDRLSAEEIIHQLKMCSTDVKDVVISGGEPTLQLKEELISKLTAAGFELHLETNGSKEISVQSFIDMKWVTCSPKQSAEQTYIKEVDALKFLHPNINKEIVIQEFVEKYPDAEIYLQPVMDDNYELNLRQTIEECKRRGYKLSLQIHKIIGEA